MSKPISPATIPGDTRTPRDVDGQIARLSIERAQAMALIARVAEMNDDQREWRPAVVEAAETAKVRVIEIAAELAPLEALYDEHRWSRWEIVQNSNGHVHRAVSTHGLCTTCFTTTEFGWVHTASGATDAEIVEAFGMTVCTVCVPDAPAMPAYATAGRVAAEAEAASGVCQDRRPNDAGMRYQRGRGYATCVCGEVGVDANGNGQLRKHRDRRVIAQEIAADPKLICGADGYDLRVKAHGYTQTFRTVRAATSAYVNAMVEAKISRFHEEYRRFADALADALAAKAGVEVDAWKAGMEKKIAAKVRQYS